MSYICLLHYFPGSHYFVHGGFFEQDDWILASTDKIKHIPTTIVQSRYDLVCPADTAWQLHMVWTAFYCYQFLHYLCGMCPTVMLSDSEEISCKVLGYFKNTILMHYISWTVIAVNFTTVHGRSWKMENIIICND